MKQIQILTLLLLSVFSTTLYAQSEQMVVALSEPGKTGTLKVALVTGSIHVSVGDNGQVVIDAETQKDNYNKPDETRTDGLKRISGNNAFEITAKEKDNEVSVSTGHPNQKINLKIAVPKNFSLKLSTVNSGIINVENVNGNLELSNVNGDVTLTNIAGSALANTVNGDIKANFKSVAQETPMAFSTLNGDVDLTFPSSLKASLKLQTQRGDILSDFDITVSQSAPAVVKTTENGMQKIKRGGWTNATINGGGPEIMMKTLNGNLIVRKSN